MVSKKKPDPEIYLTAMNKAGLSPEECVVAEDSENGVTAGKAAGMHVVATTNFYTEKEDLSRADIVVSCLGEPDGEKGELRAGGIGLAFDGVLTVEQVVKYFSS
jgi:beta-phosphoglucomutase-like phosphatase (HAD superfamily)